MRMRCKCGVTLSDVIVPNSTVYWTIPKSEWEKEKRLTLGETLDIDRTAVWNCGNCKRFYFWKSGYRYGYKLEKVHKLVEEDNNIKKDDFHYYSYNDFEDDLLSEKVLNGENVYPTRNVFYDEKNSIIKILSNNNIKVYFLEEKINTL